ncbi:MAG: hypothetical protein ACPGXZ_10940 [Saprospiraceae bacterium]
MPVNSQIILFAIQAAVRLEGQVRQAQIDRIKNHSINLLTPQFDGSVNVKSAVRWFTRSGASSIADDLELVKLVEKAEVDRRGLSDEERDRVIKEYTKIRNLDEGLVKFSGGIPKEHIFALTEVKQWEDGKNPNPSPLQRIGGSLIEIGVDYFKTTPYLANANSPQAKMLSSFLDAVDEIDFAEGQLQDIASKMMLATLEGIDSGTGFLSGDDKSNKLLKSLAKGIISDVNNFVKTEGAGNLFKQEQAKQWGQIVFKSVLSTAGETVLNNPNKFLGNGAGAEMVQSVGNCLVKGIMEDIDAGGGAIVSLKNVFTADTLDSVTKASFEVLAEHPEWYAVDNEGVKNILTQLTKEIANYPNQLGMDMLPDLVTMILAQTSGNLELIYQGDPSKPANNLLIKATTIVLSTLQDAVPAQAGQPWKPIFTKSNTIALVDVVLQEVVAKPEWLLIEAEDASPILKDVLSATFQSLQGVSIGNMNTATKMNIVKSAINAVTIQQGLLEKMNINGEEKELLNYGIDIVLDIAFGEKTNAKAKWALASGQALDMMIDAVLHRIAIEGASDSVLQLTKDFLNGEINTLTEGQGINVKALAAKLKSGDSLQSLMQNSINAATRISATLLAENPGLIKIENQGVQNMINHFVEMLATFPDDFSKAALPSLAQMVILNASANIGTIVGDNTDNPAKNLLVMTSQTVLNQLSSTDENGKVTIKYTSEQALGLVNSTIQYVVKNPSWILAATGEKSPMLEDALSAAMKAIEGVDVTKMTNDTKINILQSAIGAVALRQDLLNKVNIDGQETELLSGGIEIALSMAFGEKASAQAKWALMSGDVMDELVNGVLHRIAKEGGSEDVLSLTKEFLNGELQGLTDGQPLNIQTVISKLKSEEGLQSLMKNSLNAATRITATLLTDNADKIKLGNDNVKGLVVQLMDTLSSFPNDFSLSVLPDLAMMLAIDTSDNLGTLIGGDGQDPATNLLVMATQTVMKTISTTDENGAVKITFTPDQTLNLVDTVIQQVISKPQWVVSAAGQASPLLEDALSAAMSALDGASILSLSNESKVNIMKAAVSAVGMNKGFMQKVGVESDFAMKVALDMVFKAAQGEFKVEEGDDLTGVVTEVLTETAKENIQWALSDNATLESLSGAVLGRLATEGTSENTLKMTNQLLAHSISKIGKGETFSVSDLVAQLESPEQLAEIIAGFA